MFSPGANLEGRGILLYAVCLLIEQQPALTAASNVRYISYTSRGRTSAIGSMLLVRLANFNATPKEEIPRSSCLKRRNTPSTNAHNYCQADDSYKQLKYLAARVPSYSHTICAFLTSHDSYQQAHPHQRRPFSVLLDHIVGPPVTIVSASTRTSKRQSIAWEDWGLRQISIACKGLHQYDTATYSKATSITQNSVQP